MLAKSNPPHHWRVRVWGTWGTGLRGVDDGQPVPQPLLKPRTYPGVLATRDNPYRFVMEGEAYVRDGKVSRERQIRILAHYLDGKAYDFYMQKVASDNPNNWTLYKFFTELFNYCFPVDYRQQMRLKLEDHYQRNNQTVSEYVFELQELFSMVGTMPIEMKVIKLWYSLKAKIRWITSGHIYMGRNCS